MCGLRCEPCRRAATREVRGRCEVMLGLASEAKVHVCLPVGPQGCSSDGLGAARGLTGRRFGGGGGVSATDVVRLEENEGPSPAELERRRMRREGGSDLGGTCSPPSPMGTTISTRAGGLATTSERPRHRPVTTRTCWISGRSVKAHAAVKAQPSGLCSHHRATDGEIQSGRRTRLRRRGSRQAKRATRRS